MGFFGLKNIHQSDNASDAFSGLETLVIDYLNKEIEKVSNEWNTPGFINVALILETGVLDSFSNYAIQNHFNIRNLLKYLEVALSELGDSEFHDDLQRMVTSVKKFGEEKGIKF